MRCRFVPPCRSGRELSSLGFASSPGAFDHQVANDHELLGEHRGANKQCEALGAFGTATLHAAAAHQHRDAPFDAGAKALALLERRRSLETLALRRLAAAALWNAHHRDSAAHAGGNVFLAEEATIAAIEVRGTAEDAAVTLERGRHKNLVGRVSLEHVILGDQSLGAFGEKHLVAEFDRRAHFAALDQVGMRLEDRIDLLCIGDLLPVEHAEAGLLDHPRSETAIMRNLVADGVDLQGRQHVRGPASWRCYRAWSWRS